MTLLHLSVMKGLILLPSSVLPPDRHCNPPCRKSRPKGHFHPHEPISFWTCTVYTGPREMWNLQSLNTIHVIRSLTIQLYIFMRDSGILAFGRLVLEFWNHRPYDICVAVIRNLNGRNSKSVTCEMQLQVQTRHLASLSRGEFEEARVQSDLILQIWRKKLTFAHPRGWRS